MQWLLTGDDGNRDLVAWSYSKEGGISSYFAFETVFYFLVGLSNTTVGCQQGWQRWHGHFQKREELPTILFSPLCSRHLHKLVICSPSNEWGFRFRVTSSSLWEGCEHYKWSFTYNTPIAITIFANLLQNHFLSSAPPSNLTFNSVCRVWNIDPQGR